MYVEPLSVIMNASNLIYKVEIIFCSFLFVLFVPYTNQHFWTDLNQILHTSAPWSGGGRRVCMYPQYLNLFDLFDHFCQEPVQNPGHKMAAGPRVIATALYPWCSRRHLLQESSATALYPWCSRRHFCVRSGSVLHCG